MRIGKEKIEEQRIRAFARRNRDLIETTIRSPKLMAKFKELVARAREGDSHGKNTKEI